MSTLLIGSEGQVGRVLQRAMPGLLCMAHNLPPQTSNWGVTDTVIWCATSQPPHNRMRRFLFDFHAFTDWLDGDFKRIIFTSSSGISADWGRNNYYAAGKTASEAFLRAWASAPGRTGVVLRLGNVKREPENRHGGMTDEQIIDVYQSALLAPEGFHVRNADPLIDDWLE